MTTTIAARSPLARRLATWAVLCFTLAAAVYVLALLLAWGSAANEGIYGGGVGVYLLVGLGGNPLTQWLIYLGLVFTAGSVGAHVATEAVDRAAALRGAGTGPEPDVDGPGGEPEILEG